VADVVGPLQRYGGIVIKDIIINKDIKYLAAVLQDQGVISTFAALRAVLKRLHSLALARTPSHNLSRLWVEMATTN